MLQPRQADLPALFLVLVVLPVVLYILLGKWSEASNKKERINLIVEEAFVDSFRPEAMAAASVIPPAAPTAIAAFRECARCRGPATTRCSRCKSVRYCSGRCQIIHWRQGHKEQCQPIDDIYSSFEPASIEEDDIGREFCHKGAYHQLNGCPSQLPDANSTGDSPADTSASLGACQMSIRERTTSEKRVSRKSSKKMLDSKDRAAPNLTDVYLRSIPDPSKEDCTRHKLRGRDSTKSEEGFSEIPATNGSATCDIYTDRRAASQQSSGINSQTRESFSSVERGMNTNKVASGYTLPIREVSNSSEEVSNRSVFSHMVPKSENIRPKSAVDSECFKLSESAKSMTRAAREQTHLDKVRKRHGFGTSVPGMCNVTSVYEPNSITSIGPMKAVGLKKLSKISRKATSEIDTGDCHEMKVR